MLAKLRLEVNCQAGLSDDARQTFYIDSIEIQRYKPNETVIMTGIEEKLEQIIRLVITVSPHFLEYETRTRVANSKYDTKRSSEGIEISDTHSSMQNRYGARTIIQKFKRNHIQFILQRCDDNAECRSWEMQTFSNPILNYIRETNISARQLEIPPTSLS